MTMGIFLLVSALAQLASPAAVRHTRQPENVNSLKMIFDLVENCTASPTAGFFVDDVSHLAEGRNSCGDKFFCKVHDILHTHRNFCEKTNGDRLVRTLKQLNKSRNVQCENATTTGVQVEMSKVLKSVKRCAQQSILRGR